MYLYPYFPWYVHPPTHKYFFCLVAWSWEDFKFIGELLYWGDLISFLGEKGWTIYFHKAINDQSCKLKNSWWQNYLLHVCMLTFHTFTWEFSLKEFSVCLSVHWNSQKGVNYGFVITLWKCGYCLIWALKISQHCLVVTLWKCQYCLIWTLKKCLTWTSQHFVIFFDLFLLSFSE